MSRYRLIAVFAVVVALLSGCGSSPASQAWHSSVASGSLTKGKVLLIANEISSNMQLALTKEVGVMVSMLEGAGYKVVVASDSGKSLLGDGTAYKPDLKLTTVKTADYVGFILPSMGAQAALVPKRSIEIAKEAVALGRPMAAQGAGVWTLEQAGALTGKKFSMVDTLKAGFPSGVYAGEGVVLDGNIITSGVDPYVADLTSRKDGTAELTQKLIDALASAR